MDTRTVHNCIYTEKCLLVMMNIINNTCNKSNVQLKNNGGYGNTYLYSIWCSARWDSRVSLFSLMHRGQTNTTTKTNIEFLRDPNKYLWKTVKYYKEVCLD